MRWWKCCNSRWTRRRSRSPCRIGCWRCSRRCTATSSRSDGLLPPAVALLYRQDPHERFYGVDLAVVDLERLPYRQLIAAALAHTPGHPQPDDAHALIDSDHTRLRITEALENRERLRGDVLAARCELAVRAGHHLPVLVAIGIGSERRVHGSERLGSSE